MAFKLKLGNVLPGARRNKPRPIRYLISAAGVPNYGDDFITRTWLNRLAQLEPDSEVWLDCINPAHAALLYAGCHPNLHVTATAWYISWLAHERWESLDEKVEHARIWMREYGTPREDPGIDKIRSASSIHLLGGGYLNETWPHSIILAEIARSAKELEGMPIYGTGLGTAPCSDEWLAYLKDCVAAFDHFSVRDEESAKALGLECGIDDAFLALADKDRPWQFHRDDARVFVSLQHDVVGKHPEAVQAIANSLLASGVSENERILLVEAIAPDDCWAMDVLKSCWKGEVAPLPFSHMWDQGVPAADDAIWVASRFHLHLLGAATGARGVYLDLGSEYYDVKHASLARLGTGWTRLCPGDTDRPAPAAHKHPDFAARALKFGEQKLAEARSLYGA